MKAVPFRRVAVIPNHLVDGNTKDLNPGWLQWLMKAQSRGADAFYLRGMHCPGAETMEALTEVSRLGYSIMVPSMAEQAFEVATAIHFPENAAGFRVDGKFHGRSCHTISGLVEAESEGFEYAFFSPVYSTRTHPEAVPLGLEVLKKGCESVRIAVFALGGIDLVRETECLGCGASGIAAIGIFAQ